MGVLGDGTVVAPFANAAMRLLREDWKGKFGPKMLAEELYPILQTGIPQPDQTFQNFVTINAGNNDAFMKFIDKYGNVLYQVDAANGLQKIESPGYPPPKLKPRIVWGPKTINAGDSITPTQLDAVAVDPETGAEIPGVYVYTPPDGTAFPDPGTSTLYVNFTPTDGVKYRRAMGSTVLTIVGAPVQKIPDINWSAPSDIWLGTALSGTQLNATATDPVTFAPVAGVFVYTPPSGTVLTNDPDVSNGLSVDFTPTDTVTYANGFGATAINVNGITFLSIANDQTHGGTIFVTSEVGALIVVFAATSDGVDAGVTVTVTDSQGNGYTQVGSYARLATGGQNYGVSMWYTVSGSAGADTITVTPSTASLQGSASAVYRGGLAPDGSTSSTDNGTGMAPDSGSVSVSSDRELVISGGYALPATVTVDASITSHSGGVFKVYDNCSWGSTGLVAPKGGANASLHPITSGSTGNNWLIVSGSFTHRTS